MSTFVNDTQAMNTLDKTQIRIVKRSESDTDDLEYWLSKTVEERLAALEDIRREYNNWKYGIERRFQRVYKIVKRKRS